MRKILFCIIAITCFYFSGNGQTLGLRSPNVKWQQINTDTARIIFKEGNYLEANRISNIIHKLAKEYPTSGQYLRKVKIILQEETAISNGYVGQAPYRSEFYLQPAENAFDLGSLKFSDLLAIHEFRHVQQLSATNVGISNLLLILLGEDTYSASVHLAVPDWYLEGDAVIAETALSEQGRGRLSAFMNGFREKSNTGEPWNYTLLRNGSFKKWLPNQYPLGFLMTNYGRQKYGQNFWNEVVQDGAEYKGLFYSFSKAVKARSGLNTNQFYQKAIEQKQQVWIQQEIPDVHYEDVDISNKSLKNEGEYRNFLMPSVDEAGNVYTIIDRFDKINAIYRINPQGETKKIVVLGTQTAPFFSLGKDKLAWTELRVNPRWEREDHTVIMVYDLVKGSKKQLPLKGKYFTPGMHQNGKKIAVLNTDVGGHHEIQIIDISSGTIMDRLPNPSNLYLGYPNWAPDGERIMASARNEKGQMAIVFQDISSGEITPVTPWSYNIYGRAMQRDNWIYATSTFDQIDQVFAFNSEEGVPYQVTTGSKPHYDPAFDPMHNQIVTAEFSLMGHRLKRLPHDPKAWKAKNIDLGIKNFFTEKKEQDILTDLPNRQFEHKKYASLANPINVHSWDVSADDPVYAIEVQSENVLGSVGLVGGYRFNRNNNTYGPFVDATFGHWFPEITAGYRGTFRGVRDQNNGRYTVQQNTVSAGLRVPLRFTSGIFNQFFSIGSDINTGTIKLKPSIDSFKPRRLSYFSHSIRFVNRMKLAEQHEIPRLAQSIFATYAHDIDSLSINQFSLISDFSFPGISPNDAIILQVDYVKELSTNSILLGENFAFSRGFNAVENDEAIRIGLNYHFPFIYPDVGIGGIVFLKRVRLKPFYDHTEYRFEGRRHKQQSFGTEFLFDLNIFNVQPITFGFRWSRLLNQPVPAHGNISGPDVYEFFIPFNRL